MLNLLLLSLGSLIIKEVLTPINNKSITNNNIDYGEEEKKYLLWKNEEEVNNILKYYGLMEEFAGYTLETKKDKLIKRSLYHKKLYK